MKKDCASKFARRRGIIIKTLGLILVAGIGLMGCGKKPAPASSTPTPAPTDQAAAQSSPGAAPSQPMHPSASGVQSNGEPDLAELNRTLIHWIVRNRRGPSSFQDFASTAGVQIPPPPPGKKYVIGQNMHIQLVNQ
jgi:hypothetical protein